MKQKITRAALRALLLAITFQGTLLSALRVSVAAQQPTKVPRIGYLVPSSPSAIAARIEAFRQGLHELGYVEGKDILIEWRYAAEKLV
jgi:hypothetical protein